MKPSPYQFPPEPVISEVLTKLQPLLEPDEVEWCESILTRRDGQPGSEQLKHLVDFAYNRPDRSTEWGKHSDRQQAKKLLWAAQVQAYKQRHVLIGVPQRRQHPKYQIPNGTNILAWQEFRVSLTTCYGKEFTEARTHLAKQALADPSVTHLMYLDDDILIPQNALPRLLYANKPIISGIYTKKNVTLETTTSTIDEDEKYVYAQRGVLASREPTELVSCSLTGAGMLMVDLDVFRQMPEPWFSFVLGEEDRVVVGEDSYFIQKAAQCGFSSWCDPSVVGVHVDFKTGEYFAPEWIVDPSTRKMRPEMANKYTSFPADLNVTSLAAPDVIDIFGRNKDLTK
jgi:hypothetical protein